MDAFNQSEFEAKFKLERERNEALKSSIVELEIA